jgi:ribonuclease P protein component
MPTSSSAHGFSKSARLLKHADFERVYREGRRLTLPDVTVFWMARSVATGAARVGFTVPRALGGAVVRNRIRRRTREAVRLQLAEMASPVDIVINPRRSAQRAEFTALQQQVSEAFSAIRQGKGARPRPREASPKAKR